MVKKNTTKAPPHLSPAAAEWWLSVTTDFVLDPHHLKLLTLAAEAWDRGVQAREALAQFGLTFKDRFDAPHARPEVAIERDSRLAFAEYLRELSLDVDAPTESPRIAPRTGTRG